tara:strand:+ start:1440 stop:2420 length:981 start_codon:yes stop_codon:yes gene_type:complete
MADVKNFKARLSSSRLFSKGTKDLSDGVVDDTVFNKMTSSFENNKHLTDDVQFEYSAPLIYQLDLLKEDIDDIHSHLSESKYTDNKQKFPVVDVTKEFYVTGTTSLEGNTTISGFTDIRGDFKVNGATVSNLKPSLDFANNLRTKTLVSSSAQISSDISGSFTSLSASIATDINNAGGGSTDFTSVDSVLAPDTDNTRDLGYSNREWRNLYLDGTAYIDSIAGGTLTLPLTPPSVTHTSLKSSAVNVTAVNVLILNSSNALSIQTLTPHSVGQELTIMNIGSGAVTITRSTKASARTIYGSSNITINQHQAYKFVCNPNQVWYQIS